MLLWTTDMHGYSRFSHQLNFQLTKADFAPCCEPLLPLVAVYDSGFLCLFRVLSWSCCLIWASSSQEEEGGVTGAGVVTALSLTRLWTRESLCSVSSEHEWDLYTSSCTRAALGCFHCYFLHCHFGEGFLSQLPCWHLLCLSICIPIAETGSHLRDLIQAKSNLA